MFLTRLISGAVLLAAALVFVISGGYALLAACLALSLIGLFELYRVFGIHRNAIGYAGYACAAAYYLLIPAGDAFGIDFDGIFPFALVAVFAIIVVFAYPRYKVEEAARAFFGVYYVAVLFSFLYKTRMLPDGAVVVWLIFLSSWGCDTCAYCVGKLIGRHKMSPLLSPKKSIEGAVGGVIGTMLLTVGYVSFFLKDAAQIWLLAFISAASALLSMVGDLFASAIKRNYDIKDYGRLIPGHGGVLDRFDSVLFTAPVIYFLALRVH